MKVLSFTAHPGEEQDSQIAKFFSEFPLPGLVEYQIQRKSFFKSYEARSERFRVYALQDDEGNIQGVASFLIYDALQDGHLHHLAIALDLRVASTRAALVHWSQSFVPVIEELYREEKLTSIFSLINSADSRLANLFLRPRSMKRPLPRYFLYRKTQFVTLHGKYPWAPRALTGVKVVPAEPKILDALVHYLSKRAQYRSFSSIWDLSSLQMKIHRTPDLRLSHFLVALDNQNNIAGCLTHWSPDPTQRYVPLTYSRQGNNFRQFLKFGSMFGWCRPLTKPKDRTGKNLQLNLSFLGNIHVRNEDVFDSLLDSAFEVIGSDRFAAYTHCDNDFRLKPPRHWISSSQAHGLYCVLPPKMNPPDFLNPRHLQNPEVDAALFL